jgi:ABC-type lipoprotein export system ATPase subunit
MPRCLPPLTLIRGPSGSGKSTLLRALTQHLRADRSRPLIIRPDAITLASRPCIDLFRAPADIAMRALARAGLAEAACILRTPRHLSQGQRARLQLALALHHADMHHARAPRTHTLLILDEFAASLDPDTAAAVATLLRRRIDQSPAPTPAPALRAIVITHSEAAQRALRPDLTITLDLAHRISISRSPQSSNPVSAPHPPRLAPATYHITLGTARDYHHLAHLHYRNHDPATIIRVLTIRRRGEPIAVLVISMPTLNANWRSVFWPDLDPAITPDRRAFARRINDPHTGVRCISRIIIDPRFRSLGLATRLVAHYLNDPITPRTEALAAMAHHSRFFTAAGMRELHIPPTTRHARMLDLLHHARIQPHDLSTPTAAYERARQRLGEPLLHHELQRWLTSSPPSTRRRCPPPRDLFRLAAQQLACTPVAYASG